MPSPSSSPSTRPAAQPPIHVPTQYSTANTLILLSILIVAFFPNLFISISRYPLDLLLRGGPFSISPTSAPDPATATLTPSSSAAPHHPAGTMSGGWFQTTFTLPARARGAYLVTSHVESQLGSELAKYRVGVLHLFVQHTSCALSLNENWDEDVRADMSDALDRIVPEEGQAKGVTYRHGAEGRDDMPAHIKTALIGPSVSIPITNGRLATGTWQGIWYLEFRAAKHTRKVVATINGERSS